MQNETRQCQNCKNEFSLDQDDLGFYEKMKLPLPTFCSECRMQRRYTWRNIMSLYSGKCALCEKPVVTLYSPDSGITAYCNKCWWSDKWNPNDYAMDYDFSRPFFEQYKELMKKIPHIAIVNDDGIASLNCEYTHDWWFSKNCYMAFSGWHVENVMYSFYILGGKDIMDCTIIKRDTSWIYECINCSNSFRLKHCHLCKACIESAFLYDCRDCQNCLMCSGLRNKKYHYKNKEYSREEYEKILDSYALDTFDGFEKARAEYTKFVESSLQRYVQMFQNKDCTGDNISNSKNVKNSFVIVGCENCRYCDFVGYDKDSYDLTVSGELSECYEGAVLDHSQLNFFGLFSVKSQDIRYTEHCHNCKYIFGCDSLRNSNYCILNKQYKKEEYEEMIPKIIKHMNEMPYVDTVGRTYKYGEFFPSEFSPFGYNETQAQEHFPLEKEEAISLGFNWQNHIQKTIGKETLKSENIPQSIQDVKDDILNEILCCTKCGRNYKIIYNELNFYRNLKVPIPRWCFFCRHARRHKRINPFKLWRRNCLCEKETHGHFKKCNVPVETSFSPDRPETIYCEKCYQQEVY